MIELIVKSSLDNLFNGNETGENAQYFQTVYLLGTAKVPRDSVKNNLEAGNIYLGSI